MENNKHIVIHGVMGLNEGYSETEFTSFNNERDALHYHQSCTEDLLGQGFISINEKDRVSFVDGFTHPKGEGQPQFLKYLQVRDYDETMWLVWDQLETEMESVLYSTIALIRMVMPRLEGLPSEYLDEFLAELQHESQAMIDADDVCLWAFKIN